MSKRENRTDPAEVLGRVASTAYRYSDHDQYLKAVGETRSQEQYPMPFDPSDTSYSSRQGDAELLLVYHTRQPTDCIIEYQESPKNTLAGLQFSYVILRFKRNCQGVESPTDSPRGIRDAGSGAYRAVLLRTTGAVRQLEGVIINPPYPFLSRGKGLPGSSTTSSSNKKYLLPAMGVALFLFRKPIGQVITRLLRKRGR